MSSSPALSSRCLSCVSCGDRAEVVGDRALTALDLPALGVLPGPACYGYCLLCAKCGRTWIVLAADSGYWYGMGGGD